MPAAPGTPTQQEQAIANLKKDSLTRVRELLLQAEQASADGYHGDATSNFERLSSAEYFTGAVAELYKKAGGAGDKYSTIKRYLEQMDAKPAETTNKPPPAPDATDSYIRMLARGQIGQSLRSGGGF